MFLHEDGFLCRWRSEALGIVRTNWTKQGDSLVLDVASTDVSYHCEPMFCPGKVAADGVSMDTLQAGIDAGRSRKDYSAILSNTAYKSLFYTVGDNGHGYRVEVISE